MKPSRVTSASPLVFPPLGVTEDNSSPLYSSRPFQGPIPRSPGEVFTSSLVSMFRFLASQVRTREEGRQSGPEPGSARTQGSHQT